MGRWCWAYGGLKLASTKLKLHFLSFLHHGRGLIRYDIRDEEEIFLAYEHMNYGDWDETQGFDWCGSQAYTWDGGGSLDLHLLLHPTWTQALGFGMSSWEWVRERPLSLHLWLAYEPPPSHSSLWRGYICSGCYGCLFFYLVSSLISLPTHCNGLVAFFVTLESCHNCTLLKLFHHVVMVISWGGWTMFVLYLRFKVDNSFLSLSTSFMSSLFSTSMKSS